MNQIFTLKHEAMRRLLHLVSHGYHHYSHGNATPSKIEALTLKFCDRYRINATEMQRYRAKKQGEANAILVLYAQGKNPETIFWWLLATPGNGLVHQLEKLQDATDKHQRLYWPTGDYELVKTPRKKLSASWTWRMMPATIDAWDERIRTAIRSKNDEVLKQALYSLRRVPGFREIRREAFQLARLVESEWKRNRQEDFPHPDLFVGFLGKFKVAETVFIEDIVKKARRTKLKTTESLEVIGIPQPIPEMTDIDWVTAYQIAAEQGDSEAQYNLGKWYDFGGGVTQDDAQAVIWYRKAAEQGHVVAQYDLAMMYKDGCGVEQSDAKAVDWYQQAAEQGHAIAQYELGVMFECGFGAEQDNVQASAWYQKSAENGYANAQYLIGYMFEYGSWAKNDDRQAVFWYQKAAAQQHVEAQYALDWLYKEGRGVAPANV